MKNGKDVAVSAVVLIPDGKPPGGGWPVIAWAHEFRGTARQCAPSLMKNLGAGSILAMFANLGFAVVATDYAGFGRRFRPTGGGYGVERVGHSVFDSCGPCGCEGDREEYG